MAKRPQKVHHHRLGLWFDDSERFYEDWQSIAKRCRDDGFKTKWLAKDYSLVVRTEKPNSILTISPGAIVGASLAELPDLELLASILEQLEATGMHRLHSVSVDVNSLSSNLERSQQRIGSSLFGHLSTERGINEWGIKLKRDSGIDAFDFVDIEYGVASREDLVKKAPDEGGFSVKVLPKVGAWVQTTHHAHRPHDGDFESVVVALVKGREEAIDWSAAAFESFDDGLR